MQSDMKDKKKDLKNNSITKIKGFIIEQHIISHTEKMKAAYTPSNKICETFCMIAFVINLTRHIRVCQKI